MMNTIQPIEDLIEYMDLPDVPGQPKWIGDVEQALGRANLRVIAFNLLCWLNSPLRRPLQLNMKYPWSNMLVQLLHGDNPLSGLFEAKEGTCDFAPGLSAEDMSAIRALVAEKFHPPLMT